MKCEEKTDVRYWAIVAIWSSVGITGIFNGAAAVLVAPCALLATVVLSE